MELSPAVDLKPETSTVLLGVADRIEHGNGDYPALMQAAAGLATVNGDTDERERAVHASKTIIRPLAERPVSESAR